MAKVRVRFRETITYNMLLDVPDDVAALPEDELEEWLRDGEDDSRYFDLACEQQPNWSHLCLEGGIDKRELVSAKKEE